MSLKCLTTGLAAATLVAAAAVGVTSIASVPTTATPAITPVVFGAPLPLQTGDPLDPTLKGVLTTLAGPGSFRDPSKSGLIEGGVGIIEGRTADRLYTNAVQNGDMPLKFDLGPIQSDGTTATTTVTATGPRMSAPVSQQVMFLNDGTHWMVSKNSAMALLSAAGAA
ncbi:MAG: hypothetical protein QOE41_4789 [Mycobacterium sp.]|nr:low molecular weight antigen Cfp2 [Mycobacterium sp.]MDT5135478.1 hypothetical protein [Mycobacterium sp.]